MIIRLREHGTSFATRERARTLLASLGDGAARVDFDDVLCSPSFLAEFILGLTRRSTLTAMTNDEIIAQRLRRIVSQLRLTDSVRIEHTVPA